MEDSESPNITTLLLDREVTPQTPPTTIQRYLNSKHGYQHTRLGQKLSGSANWGADFSADGQLFVCRGTSHQQFHVQFWDWQRRRLVSHCPYPLKNLFHIKCLEDYAVIWDRETCFLGIVGIEESFTYLEQLVECLDAVDAVAVLPGCPNEVLIADDKGRLYIRDRRKQHLIGMGQVQVITADCQSVTSLDRNPVKPHEFCVCSSWGRQLVIGDLRTTGRPSGTLSSYSFHFFQQRGPDTFSAAYNSRGNRLLVHWKNGLLLSDPEYATPAAFHHIFSTHLDLFDVKLFGVKEDCVLIGHQSSPVSEGMDTVEIRELPPSSGNVIHTLHHPSTIYSAANFLDTRVTFGMRLYVNPRMPVFAVGSTDESVLFYHSSLV